MKCACPCGEEFEPERSNQKYIDASHKEKMRNIRRPRRRLSNDEVAVLNGLGERQEPNSAVGTTLLGGEMAQTNFPSLLTQSEAARLLGLAPKTLKYWRTRRGQKRSGPGPAYIKLGRKVVRYAMQDLADWLKAGIIRRQREK